MTEPQEPFIGEEGKAVGACEHSFSDVWMTMGSSDVWRRCEKCGMTELDEAAIQRMAEHKKLRGWRPIDTAPKDGTLIDVWRSVRGFDGTKRTGRVPNVWWDDRGKGSWVRKIEHGDYYGDVDDVSGEDYRGDIVAITHWQPIPPPPEGT